METGKKNDNILIAVILVIALLFGVVLIFTQKSAENGMVIVTIDGAEYARYSLDENIQEKIVQSDGSYNILEIKDGEVDVTEASCPDGICVDHHKISKTNQNIVCLPNKVVISIENSEEYFTN